MDKNNEILQILMSVIKTKEDINEYNAGYQKKNVHLKNDNLNGYL